VCVCVCVCVYVCLSLSLARNWLGQQITPAVKCKIYVLSVVNDL